SDAAAELGAHRLHAIADREDWHAELEDDPRRARRRCQRYRGRPARQDHGPRGEVADFIGRHREGMNLAIHPVLADAPGDELGDLAAEIEDQDAVVHVAGFLSNRATKKPSVPWRAGVRRR